MFMNILFVVVFYKKTDGACIVHCIRLTYIIWLFDKIILNMQDGVGGSPFCHAVRPSNSAANLNLNPLQPNCGRFRPVVVLANHSLA